MRFEHYSAIIRLADVLFFLSLHLYLRNFMHVLYIHLRTFQYWFRLNVLVSKLSLACLHLIDELL